MGLFKRLAIALGLQKHNATIIVVGLDDSGKTTLISRLKPRKSAVLDIVPTVGFSQERFEKGKLRFNVFDMSGAGNYRGLWETYYRDVQAVIFVVDSSDKLRLCVARDELHQLLAHRDIAKNGSIPVLLFANKHDVPFALAAEEVSSMLGLDSVVGSKPWHMQTSNALTGEGLEQGFDWLAKQIVNNTR